MPPSAPAWLDRWITGELPLEELAAGRIALPSGRVIACDPLVSLETSGRPFTRAVPEGRYPVTLGLLEGDVALASVRFGRAKVARWELALSAGERDEGRPGYGVDSGKGCFADADAAEGYAAQRRALGQRVAQQLLDEGVDPKGPSWHEAYAARIAEEGPDLLAAAAMSAAIQKKRFASIVLGGEGGGSLVAFTTGVGDGVYASYWGLDAKGRPMMLVTDFGLLDRGAQRSDGDEEREDEDEMDEDDDDDMDLEELEEWLERRVPSAEAPPAASPLLPRAEQLLKRWESSGKLALEDDCDRRALAEALLEKLVTLEGHRHLGGHLAEWLIERSEVADVFASDDELEADLRAP